MVDPRDGSCKEESGQPLSHEMKSFQVQIVKFLGCDPQPGIIEFVLVDADGKSHTFVDKVPIVSLESLDEFTEYPPPGSLRCRVFGRSDVGHTDRVRIMAERESVEGALEFDCFVKSTVRC